MLHGAEAGRPRAQSSNQPRRREAPQEQYGQVSDEATASFIRRTLCGHKTRNGSTKDAGPSPPLIEELLPPLTSSNEVDLQLYALVAIIIRELVDSWYARIAKDHVFVEEVIQMIAHCTRVLEQRLRNVDFEELLLDEIPGLVAAHVAAYRQAHHPLYPPSLPADPRLVYHTLHPHPALSPVPDPTSPTSVAEQKENEAAYRQLLAQGVLALLLPTEDLENGCLRTLLADVLGDMVLGTGIGGRACEGWLWWEGIANVAQHLQRRRHVRVRDGPASATSHRRQAVGVKEAPVSAADGNTHLAASSSCNRDHLSWLSVWLWRSLHWVFLAFLALRFLVAAVATSPSLPSRCASSSRHSTSNQAEPTWASAPPKPPILAMGIWPCMSSLLDLSSRMPWLEGALALIRQGLLAGPGKTDGLLDRLLSHELNTHLLSPSHLPIILLALRTSLFPNNALPAKPRPTPSESERAAIKARCADSLLALVPATVRGAYIGHAPTSHRHGLNSRRQKRQRHQGERYWEGKDEGEDAQKDDDDDDDDEDWIFQRAVLERGLDVFGDAYLNKHLVFAVLELVLVRTMPELRTETVKALLDERLGGEDD